MTRLSAALLAGSAVFALLLAGCGTDDSGDSAQSTAATTSTAPAAAVDNVRAGMFVVSYRNAFPALTEGRADSEIADMFGAICGSIAAGESEDTAVADIVARTDSAATTEEALAIYATARYMC